MPTSAPPPRSARPGPFEQMSAVPPPTAQGRQNINVSSVEGGIFGGGAQAPAEPRVGVTKSSIAGGIFGDQNPYAQSDPTANPTKQFAPAPIDESKVAGAPLARGENFSLFKEGAAPLAPLPSARSNPNASSVEGGIFGPPQAHKPTIVRSNPNASSIQGGIFG